MYYLVRLKHPETSQDFAGMATPSKLVGPRVFFSLLLLPLPLPLPPLLLLLADAGAIATTSAMRAAAFDPTRAALGAMHLLLLVPLLLLAPMLLN